MARVNEHEIFAKILGEKVNLRRLEQIGCHNGKGSGAYSDCDEYYIANVDYDDKEAFQQRFRLTETLLERWHYYGIDFSIYLYVSKGTVAGGHIYKYRETSMTSHYRPSGYAMEPTQQEIRVANRMLNYLTEEEDNHGC